MFKPINKEAFTLIELLVVIVGVLATLAIASLQSARSKARDAKRIVMIAIIGILVILAIISLQGARAKARDAKRIADVRQMMTALELYFNDARAYPSSSSVTSSIYYQDKVYMAILPSSPTKADGRCDSNSNQYIYSEQEAGNRSYTISFCLGANSGSLASGDKCATPNGIIDQGCSSILLACGDTLIDSRDSEQYLTVQIGN